jgi:predicted ATPase
MMKLSLQNGLSAMSSVAFAGYGSLLCFMGKAEEGQRFGKLGLDLVDRFNASSFRPRCIALVYGCIQPAMQPWKNSIYQLIEGHRLGLMTGDVESAIFNANLALAFMLDDGSFKYRDLVGHLDDIIELTKAHGQSRHVSIRITCFLFFPCTVIRLC